MIQINAKTFADALALVSGAVERKTTIPILSNVRIDGDWRRGTLTLQGTDLENALSVTIPATIVSEIHLTAPCRELLAFVKTVDKTVDLKLQKTGIEAIKLDVDAAGMKAEFCGMGVDNFPERPKAPAPSVMIPAAVLADALRKTTFAVANEESRYTLIGSLFEVQGESLKVTATDGHRLSHYSSAAAASTADFRGLIRGAALSLLAKMAKRSKGVEVQLSRDENHAYFQIGGALLTTRTMSGQFPDYERVMPKHTGENTATVNRKQLAAALKQVGKFADERSHAVRFAVNGKFEIMASGSAAGSGKIGIPVEHVGLDVENVGYNCEYLLDLLAAVDAERVTLDFGRPQTTESIYQRIDDSNGGWGYRDKQLDAPIWDSALSIHAESAQFVVMPMRV